MSKKKKRSPRPPKKSEQSPALELVLHVWKYSLKTTQHSWERLNHTMYASMKLAITGGLEFAVGDFEAIGNHCRPEYWLHIEQAYLMAVATPNLPACRAIEKYLEREPIIADSVSGQGWNHYSSFSCTRGRLAVDCTFSYQGLNPKVTSFRDGCVVACTYKPNKKDEYRNKVDRRFTLSQVDIVTDRKVQKERTWILECSWKAWGNEATEKFIDLLGSENCTKSRLRMLPRKKIDAALKTLGLTIGKPTDKTKKARAT